MLECFGAAVNDDALKAIKARFDANFKAYLVDIFDASPTIFMKSSKSSAEISYGLMIGLRSGVYFDDDIDLPDAHHLFLTSMLAMCGLEEGGELLTS